MVSVFDERWNDSLHEIDRHCEPDARALTRFAPDLCVHPDHRTVHIEQGTTGVARVDCRVGLHHRRNAVPGKPAPECPAHCTYYPRGHREFLAKRIAEGNSHLARPQVGRAADGDRHKLVFHIVELDDSQVGVEVPRNDVGGVFAPVEELDCQKVGILDHVVVCDYVPVGVPHEPRA